MIKYLSFILSISILLSPAVRASNPFKEYEQDRMTQSLVLQIAGMLDEFKEEMNGNFTSINNELTGINTKLTNFEHRLITLEGIVSPDQTRTISNMPSNSPTLPTSVEVPPFIDVNDNEDTLSVIQSVPVADYEQHDNQGSGNTPHKKKIKKEKEKKSSSITSSSITKYYFFE